MRVGETWPASSTSSSVVSPIAEATTQTRPPALDAPLATCRIRSGVPSDVPPYFCTRTLTASHPGTCCCGRARG